MTVRPVIRILIACAALAATFPIVSRLVQSAHASAMAPTQGLSKGWKAPAAPVSNPASFAPVESFLKTNCVECHGPTKQKADLTLAVYHDEASVLKDRKVWEDVLEKLQSGEMPPKKKARPDKDEAQAFIKSIEGIFYRHDLVTPRDPGHVTIRRLNRTEYNNTIRDLVGVDATPAEDFPSDDVGQGFDNIGDVLSISPVLMERYLAAAESVMQGAIPLELPPPLTHQVNWRYLEPAIRESSVPKGQNRPLLLKKSVFTHYTVSLDGPYTISFGVYADTQQDKKAEAKPADGALDVPAELATPEKPKDFAMVAILVDGKELTKAPVASGNAKNPLIVKTKVSLQPGDHRLELALVHTPGDDPKWILRVRRFAMEGPPDTRPLSQRRLLACDPKLSKQEKSRFVLQRFATRAYRRPVTTDELDHLLKIAEQAEQQKGKWEVGIEMAMEAVLISPKFLFRVELDDRPDTAGPHPIAEYQLASRLSYFIWSTMPDEELFTLAAKNQLSANLEAQVRRMLKDPRSSALVDNFAMQWLQLRRLKTFAPDTSMFPAFDERLRLSMQRETSLFIGAIIHEDRSILDFLDADFTFLNGPLARFYGIADTHGNYLYQKPITDKGMRIDPNSREFVRVHLADRTRGGILTQASVLCVTSNPTRTSPVKRGKFVLEQILGMPPPPPPPNVPPLNEVKTVSEGGSARISLRQRMEQHRADPACANCHEHMDGLGFAFENFDAVGGYRSEDGGITIDPSGTMPDGTSFKGAAELKSVLKERTSAFSRCLTKKLLTYATGRGVEYYDQTAVNTIVAALEHDNFKFSTLVVEIAKSDPFRLQRGKEQNP